MSRAKDRRQLALFDIGQQRPTERLREKTRERVHLPPIDLELYRGQVGFDWAENMPVIPPDRTGERGKHSTLCRIKSHRSSSLVGVNCPACQNIIGRWPQLLGVLRAD